MLEKNIAILFCLGILLNGILARSVTKTWLSPACLFSLFWFLMTFFPLILLFSTPVHPLAMAYILACVIAFSAGCYCFNWRQAIRRNYLKNDLPKNYFNNRFLRCLFLFLQPVIIFFLMLHSLEQGISLSDIFFNFFKSAGQYAKLRYAENVQVTIFSRSILTLTYVSVSIGGLLMRTTISRWKRCFIVCSSFLPSIIIMLTQSSKGAFFLSAAFFFGGVLINRVFNSDLELINKTTVKAIFWSVLLVFPAIILSFIARGLSDQNIDYVLWKLSSYLISYSSAHVYAFSDWMSWCIGGASILEYKKQNIEYGFYNYMALFQAVGYDLSLPKGVFDDYFMYGNYLKTNIFSIFRGLIIDFGFFGSLLHMCILGFFSHLSFYLLLCLKRPVFPSAIFIILVGYIYQSYIISLFNYRTTYLTFVLLSLVLLLNKFYMITVGSKKKI